MNSKTHKWLVVGATCPHWYFGVEIKPFMAALFPLML